MEKIENDFTDAKYKQREWVRFKEGEYPYMGKVKYHCKGRYFVCVPFEDREIMYEIKEEDIMEEQAKYGNKSYIEEQLEHAIEKEKKSTEPSHYDMPITPIDFIQKNGLGFIEGCIVKYVARFRRKNGKEDLLKARKYIDLLIKYEYGE